MELTAAIQALKLFKDKEYLKVYTDSNYLKQGITLWINSWKKNNWNNKQKKLVKNVDLWKELDFFNNHHNIKWYWVKAHDGNFGNEKADMLANKAIDLKISNL
jgi:ribonuclease HI